MGLSLDALWGDAKRAAETGMSDLLRVGGSSALGYLEGQAIAILEADKKQHEAEFQKAITANLTGPTNPNSFGSYLSRVASSPVLKEFGPSLMIGVAVIAILAIAMRKG